MTREQREEGSVGHDAKIPRLGPEKAGKRNTEGLEVA